MATIDYKQKIKDYMNSSEVDILYKSMLNNLFPELKESEGERIRKEIISALKFANVKGVYDKHLAWLEKQGEHAKFCDSIQVGDKVTRNKDGVLVNLSQLKRVAKKDEKQGEQKPADETKFKVGDWVVYCNDDVDLITGIEENGYSINNSGYIPFVCASDVRLWTIQDAKDGDVLVSESNCGLGTWYCIFKSLDDDESMTVYCYLSRDGRFETKKELCFDKATYNTKPATKEQRDFLFQKMKEEGYEWNAEKKELKKIEYKHICELDNSYDCVTFPFKAKVKSSGAIVTIHDGQLSFDGKEWIKYQSDAEDGYRVYEPNNLELVCEIEPAWSEEDKKKLLCICAWIKDYPRIADFKDEICTEANNYIDWLKSLKERYTWKPSEGHLKALEDAMNKYHGSYSATLCQLYGELKKLKE